MTTNFCDLASAEDRPITIMSPVSWQVFQRVGFDPKNTANAGTDNSAFGYAQVEVEGSRVLLEEAAGGRHPLRSVGGNDHALEYRP